VIFLYDDDLNLTTYLYEYAKRTALNIKGSEKEIAFSNITTYFGSVDDELDDYELDPVISLENCGKSFIDEERIQAKVKGDKLIAKSVGDVELLRKLPGICDDLSTPNGSIEKLANNFIDICAIECVDKTLVLDSLIKLNSLRVPDVTKTSTWRHELSVDNVEIRAIRFKMNKTKQQFANDISLPVSTLDSYEYGRTKSVPEDIMERARRLYSNYTDTQADDRAMFLSMPMSKIVVHWSDSVKVDIDEQEQLALIFGTTRTTLRRWLSNESRASMDKILGINDKVKSFAKNLSSLPTVNDYVVENAHVLPVGITMSA